jgi:predicted GNAT family acetyltransferase
MAAGAAPLQAENPARRILFYYTYSHHLRCLPTCVKMQETKGGTFMQFIHNKNEINVYDADKNTIAQVTFPCIDVSTVDVNHTFVDDSLRGQGIAGELMRELAAELRFQNKKAILTCPYAVNWFEKRKEEYSDILAP